MYEKHEEPSCWDSKDGFCILASPDEQIRKFVVEGRWGDRLTYIVNNPPPMPINTINTTRQLASLT